MVDQGLIGQRTPELRAEEPPPDTSVLANTHRMPSPHVEGFLPSS